MCGAAPASSAPRVGAGPCAAGSESGGAPWPLPRPQGIRGGVAGPSGVGGAGGHCQAAALTGPTGTGSLPPRPEPRFLPSPRTHNPLRILFPPHTLTRARARTDPLPSASFPGVLCACCPLALHFTHKPLRWCRLSLCRPLTGSSADQCDKKKRMHRRAAGSKALQRIKSLSAGF